MLNIPANMQTDVHLKLWVFMCNTQQLHEVYLEHQNTTHQKKPFLEEINKSKLFYAKCVNVLYSHVPLGSRTFSSLRATCAWSGRPPESRERLGLLRPGLMAVACRLVPASLSVVLEEPWLASRLSGRTRLTAKEDDHWEEDEEEEEEAFCDEMGRTWSESADAVRGELLFWKMEKHEWSYKLASTWLGQDWITDPGWVLDLKCTMKAAWSSQHGTHTETSATLSP